MDPNAIEKLRKVPGFKEPEYTYEATPKLSDQSIEVLEYFGAEAPALLNEYANALEDLVKDLGAALKSLTSEASS